MEKQRIEWLDFLKGIGIILVMVGHSFRDKMRMDSFIADFIYSIIYVFHMPLFFAVSGYLFKINYNKYVNEKPRKFLILKSNTYLYPFCGYTILIYIFVLLINQIDSLREMLNDTSMRLVTFPSYIRLALECNNPYAFHLWFLFGIFIILVFVFFAAKLEHRLSVKEGSLILGISFVLWNVRIFFAGDWVMILKILLKYPIFFAVGMFYEKWEQRKSKGYIIISILSWLYCILYVLKIFNDSTGFMWYLKNVVLLCSTIIIIDNFFSLSNRIKFFKPLNILGQKSMYYYLFHQPFCCGLLGALLYQKMEFSIIVTCICCIIASILFPWLLIKLKSKSIMFNKILRLFVGV